MVKIGESLPNVDLFENLPENKVNLAELSLGKKIIIIGVPGAFTPGCSKTHLPGYVKKSDDLKRMGVAEIFCVAVNDPYVLAAWAEDQNAAGKVRILADPAGDFTRALNLTMPMPHLGGERSRRYAMVVDDGKVTTLKIEPDGTGLTCSLVEAVKI